MQHLASCPGPSGAVVTSGRRAQCPAFRTRPYRSLSPTKQGQAGPEEGQPEGRSGRADAGRGRARRAIVRFILEHRAVQEMEIPEPIVRVENVALGYDGEPEILRDITFSLEPGSFNFLIGASGAGKSTLLKLMYLALRPSSGFVGLFGQDVATIPRNRLWTLRRRIGVVFQDFRLLDHLSALENVVLPLRVAGADSPKAREHVAELLRWVGLEKHIHSLPETLSGGEQQRVAIARAVIDKPSLLLADEPTGNVDDGIGTRLLYLFEELNRMGTTVVIATHNEALISRFDHPHLVLEGGTLTQRAPIGRKRA